MNKENYIEKLKKLHEKYLKREPINSDKKTFTTAMEGLVNVLVENIVAEAKKGYEPEKLENLIVTKIQQRKIPAKETETMYGKMLDHYLDATNIRKQELEMDLVERRRYLRYRIYTAIGIAIVVLITGYIAQRFHIPLPMLNRLPIQ